MFEFFCFVQANRFHDEDLTKTVLYIYENMFVKICIFQLLAHIYVLNLMMLYRMTEEKVRKLY